MFVEMNFKTLLTDYELIWTAKMKHILADSLESFVTLTYAEKEHKINASYSDWIDTKDNDLLILYEPSKAKSGKD